MDPDLVRQQEEAEREALAKLPKTLTAKTPTDPKAEAAIAPLGPVFFSSPATVAPGSDSLTPIAITAALPPIQPIRAPDQAAAYVIRPVREPVMLRLGRFISYGVAGVMLGGSLGIVALNALSLPPEQANLIVFGPAAALALVCAFASLSVTNAGIAGGADRR